MQGYKTLALALLAVATIVTAPVLAACKDCGSVAEVRSIGKDTANDASTAAAVKAGATYQVVVKLDNGKSRSFTFLKAPDYKVGDKVKIVDGMKLAKQ
jgi:hypothetical protein